MAEGSDLAANQIQDWKHLWQLFVLAAIFPIGAGAAEWRMIPNEVNAGVALTNGPVIGAVLVDSIKKNGDHAEAQVSMFYSYDLVQVAVAKVRSKDPDLMPKLEAAFSSGRDRAYVGLENMVTETNGAFGFYNDVQIRTLLVASEILIDEGYPPMATRTLQVLCKSKLDFGYRYADEARGENWATLGLPSNGSAQRGELYPFICDKLGMGQNDPAPPPAPAPEMVLI